LQLFSTEKIDVNSNENLRCRIIFLNLDVIVPGLPQIICFYKTINGNLYVIPIDVKMLVC